MAINYAAFAGLTPQQVYGQFPNGLPVGWDWGAYQAAQPASSLWNSADLAWTTGAGQEISKAPWTDSTGATANPWTLNAPGGPLLDSTGNAPGTFQLGGSTINMGGGTRGQPPGSVPPPGSTPTSTGNGYVSTTPGSGTTPTPTPPPTDPGSTGSYVQTKPAQEIPTKNPTGATTAYEQPLPAAEQGDGFSPFKSAPSSMQNPGAPSSAFPINIAGGTNPVIPQPVFRKAPEGGNPIVNAMVRRRRSPWDSY